MAEIRVPTLGESVTEATIGKWFKKPGEAVAVDEPLVELETDKVTIEVPAPAAGVLSDIAANDGETVAVGRIEELYPFPSEALEALASSYKRLEEVVWVQEEPRNMGAWHFVEHYLEWVLNQIEAKNRRPRYATRPASAATAVGQLSKHQAQLKQLLDEALK